MWHDGRSQAAGRASKVAASGLLNYSSGAFGLVHAICPDNLNCITQTYPSPQTSILPSLDTRCLLVMALAMLA